LDEGEFDEPEERIRLGVNAELAFDELVAALPARFLEITVGEKPVQALSTYVVELSASVLSEGVRAELVQKTTVEVMEAIDASPADWYRRATSRPAS
jgi:hypothetical protein